MRCEIEIETIGDRPPSRFFKATVRRIQHDGLLPLSFGDGRPAEYVESDAADALARAKLFLDRRFGFGALEEAPGGTAGMRLFALQEAPDHLVIAGYGRYGCPVCRIGEPDEEKFDHWLAHAHREHGYDVVSDRREVAPWIPDIGRHFRVVRLRRKTLIKQTVATITPHAEVAADNRGAEPAPKDPGAEGAPQSLGPESATRKPDSEKLPTPNRILEPTPNS